MADNGYESLNPVANNQRLTQKQKDANDKEWYKQQANIFASRAFTSILGYGEINEYTRKKINYDLFNNIIDLKDFEYVCMPYGANVGEMPAKMVNRDIVSGKIKVLLGMEMQRPFSWTCIATNEEATTRKVEEKNKRISSFVISEIMTPIQQQIELEYQQKTKGQKLSPDEQNQIQQQIQQEIQQQTPPEVAEYMLRTHKDPSEVLSTQILQYLIKEQNIQFKFNVGWKHAALSGEEFYWTGIINGKPVFRIINPLYFDYERTSEHFFVEEGSWAVCELRLTPDEIVKWFSSELSEEEIDDIYNKFPYGSASSMISSDFNINGYSQDMNTIRVLHIEWKSLRLIKFLTYFDEQTEQEEEMTVTEEYILNKKAGDISIREEWIPEAHECYRIADDMYKSCQPIPGQHKDLNNLYNCKLRYHGTAYDNLNSAVTAIMDRIKPYQYFHNIIMFRIEMLITSDKGKKLLGNINMIPKSAGIDIKQWLYYFDALGIGWVNPNEEGNKHNNGNIGEAFKEIDMSLASQINNYIQLADKIDEKAGLAIGITRQMEGQLGPTDAVTNTKQSIVQSSYIIEPYFNQHNEVKARVLQSLVEVAKTAYVTNPPASLNYVLDDMSLATIMFDANNLEVLENNTIGIFISNDSKAFRTKQTIEDYLAHAAIQNDKADLSDIIKIIRSDSVQEAEELLEESEQRKRTEKSQEQSSQQQAQAQEAEKVRQFEREKWGHDADMIKLKETERRQTELEKAEIQAVGFDKDKDMNHNNQPDAVDLADHLLDKQAQNHKQNIENRKLNHQISNDNTKNELSKQKLAIDKKKAKQKPSQS